MLSGSNQLSQLGVLQASNKAQIATAAGVILLLTTTLLHGMLHGLETGTTLSDEKAG